MTHGKTITPMVVILGAIVLVFAYGATGVVVGQTDGKSDVINWVELNPAFEGATYVNDESVCATCHEDAVAKLRETMHGGALTGEKGTCESCHGPRSKHVDAPDTSLTISNTSYSAVCLQCHQDADRMYWQGGPHSEADVGCVSCHTVMEKRSVKGFCRRAIRRVYVPVVTRMSEPS